VTTASRDLPRGLAGLQYPITQVSLAVRDLERTMERYWRAFGWSGWDVFDHKPPTHHNTELRGEPVDYTLKGAEVMVGSLNFELLEPVDGPSLWKEFIRTRGEGVASIAVMFKTLEDGEASSPLTSTRRQTHHRPTSHRLSITRSPRSRSSCATSRRGCGPTTKRSGGVRGRSSSPMAR
jgi:hypothetical protein